MFQSFTNPVTFEEFLDCQPQFGRYELHSGVIIELQPTETHERIAAF